MLAMRRPSWLAITLWILSLALLSPAAAPAQETAPNAAAASPAATSPAAPPTGPPPALVVAIDTSRSLQPAALAATLAEVGRTLAALPAGIGAGVLAFDDNARWQAEPGSTAAAAQASLAALRPQGNYTLLHDALFEAARRLEQGGVILLLTDGRDENSATTVEDIARRCEMQKVRILTVGIGNRVEEKALRRLALLTRGDYLGKGLAATRAAAAVADSLHQVEAERQEERKKAEAALPKPAPPRQEVRPLAPAPAPAPEPGLLDYLPWILSALLALAFFVYVLLRQQAARRKAAEEVESLRQDEEFQVADEADAAAIRLELAQVPVAQPRDSPEVTVDTAVLQRMTLDERLERTRVLSSMLILKKPGEAPRSFLLDRDKAFSVGRDREKNTLAVPDPALSSQHFRVVPRGGVYYFVDLESTNGSYIGTRKVRAKRLRTGDVIRAGQVEFEYQSYGEAA